MTDKELIRRALMGSREAQRACTDKGIALPCPYCGGDAELRHLSHETSFSETIDVFCVTCKKCGCNPFEFSDYNLFYTSKGIQKAKLLKQKALEKWNTRPAPPVGRRKDCKSYTALGHCEVHSQEPDQHGPGAYVEMLPDDFYSYFEPREE